VSHGQVTPHIADLGPDINYVADAGPLLCLGGSKPLRDVVTARCHHKTHWVEAVRAELLHQSKGIGPRARAASVYNGRGAAWLTMTVTFTAVDDQDLTPIRERLRALGEAKALRKGRAAPADPRAHLGEAQSILHANRGGYTLLAHDDDALRVARERGVPAATLVDLARRLVAEARASAKQLADGFLTLQRDGIDTGEHITGQLDLGPQRRPRIPSQRPPTQYGT